MAIQNDKNNLPGAQIDGDNVRNYIVKQAILFNDNTGFALAHNPEAVAPYVTWHIFNNDGRLEYEMGHYVSTESDAVADYISRCETHTASNNLTEIPVPPPTRFERTPQSNHTAIVDITNAAEESDRTYKAELQLPDQDDPHLEVFSAENDVEAVKYAHELCKESADIQLLEVHELDENYDIIREIDLQTHEPKAQSFDELLKSAQRKADILNSKTQNSAINKENIDREEIL